MIGQIAAPSLEHETAPRSGTAALDTPSLIAADAIIALGEHAAAARRSAQAIGDPLAIARISAIVAALRSSEGHLTMRLRALAEAQGQVDRLGTD